MNKVVIVVQLLSQVWLFAAPWTATRQASPSFTIFWSLLRLMSIELVMPSNHLILCCPLLLPSIFPSIRVFPNESALCIRWPEYRNFSFRVSPSSDTQGWFPLRLTGLICLILPGTLKNLLQHHSLKASILWCSAFFIVQISHLYMTTGKTIALIILTFVSKMIFLLLKKFCHSFSSKDQVS